MRRYRLLLKGKAKDIFAMLALLAITENIEQSRHWWQVRATIIASDMDRQIIPGIDERLN